MAQDLLTPFTYHSPPQKASEIQAHPAKQGSKNPIHDHGEYSLVHRLLELLLIEELQDEGSLLRDRKSLNLDQDTWGNARGKKKADGNCQ